MLARIGTTFALRAGALHRRGRAAEISVAQHRPDHSVRGRRRRRSDRPAPWARRSPSSLGRPWLRSTATARPARWASPSSRVLRPTATRCLQPVDADRQRAVPRQGRALHAEFVRIHLPGVRERLRHRGRPELEIQDREGPARRREEQARRSHLRACRHRIDPASVGRELGRCAEVQGAAPAVSRRRRDDAGADQGRH